MVPSQYWFYIVYWCFVQRSSIRWNNGAVIDEYFPIIYENWKLSITSIYKYLLYLANIGKHKLQRILKIMVCGLSSLLSVSSNWAAPGREGKHFSFLQKKRISYHFSFLQKKMRSHHFSCPQKKRSSATNFLFSSRIKSLTRYKSANICELGVVSCVDFSWLCYPHEPKKMFFFVRGQGYIKERWPLIYELLSDLESGRLDARPANTLDQSVTAKKNKLLQQQIIATN